MNTAQLKPLLISLTTALMLHHALVFAGNGPGMGNTQPIGVCPSITSGIPISAEEIASLNFMREEEKLARDVYQTMADQWQMQIFANIASSEQAHMDQMKCLLDGYGLADSATNEVGVFNNEELQNLYQDLISRGTVSLNEALRVGALVEEVDIKDLDVTLNTTQIPEIRLVYENLRSGSENHLQAFVGTLAQLGETYTSQVLEQEAVETILTPLTQPAVFDLDTRMLQIPALRLSQEGNLLPLEETYRLMLQLNEDGTMLQVIDLEKIEN